MNGHADTYRIREADPAADRSRIIEGLRRHLNARTDERRFDWLYRENPAGPARIWIVEDPGAVAILGSCALLPREFSIGGTRIRGAIVADSWVHPDYRFLGPALKLQKACMQAISDDGFRLVYDFPRKSMVAIYRRLRLEPRDHLTDFVKLVRADAFLANRIGDHAGSRVLSALANPLLRALDGPSGGDRYAFALETAACGTEFTDLFDRSTRDAGQAEVRVAHTAEYLNWRYHEHFHQRHEFLVAREAGRLAGYLVFIDDPVRATCVDLLCTDDESLPRRLLRQFVAVLRRRRCQSVAFPLLAGDPLAARVRAAGFRPLASTPLILMPSDGVAAQVAAMRISLRYGDESD
jgi:hypothetical protein